MNLSTYKSEEIGQRLKNIEGTQESIVENCGVFLKLGNEGFAKRLSEDWIQYFKRFNTKESWPKRLSLLYLANDILQKCKAETQPARDFLEFFRPILIEAAKLTAEQNEANLKETFKRLSQIWRERKVYPKEYLKELQEFIHSKDIQISEVAKASLPESITQIPSELLDFLEAEKELSRWTQNEREERLRLEQFVRGNMREDEAKLRLDAFKKTQEFKHKYRTIFLTKLCELLRLCDVEHTRLNHLIKKSTTLIEELSK